MNRLFKVVGGAVLVAVMGFAMLGVAVYAQDATDTDTTSAIGDYVEQMWNAVAEKLGVERSELDAAMKDARTDVAAKAVEDGVITQDQADRMAEGEFGGHPFGMRSKMFGFRGHMGDCVAGDKLSIAEDLGMTADELAAELEAGKTLDEVAEEQGVDLEAIRIEHSKAKILQAVEDGTLTQEQADWMIEGLEKGLAPGMPGIGGFRGGNHGFRGFGRGEGTWFGRGQIEPAAVPSDLSNS